MKEFFVKEVMQSELQKELNAFSEQWWRLIKLHAVEHQACTFWTIIVDHEKDTEAP